MLLVDSVLTSKQVAYRNYLLTVLLLVLAFNYVDRLALGLLMQDIKRDLSLTDIARSDCSQGWRSRSSTRSWASLSLVGRIGVTG